ncbi:hypothetical protein Tco_0530009 [Tanacetum coccineum]
MSDSEHSTVTYTSVSIPVEDDSDMGLPGVDGPPSPDYVPGPEEPEQEPPSPDYVPGPEEPEQAPPLPVYLPYVPEPVYPEYIPPEEDVFPAEEQPLPAATLPTADSPGYIPESDPERDPEEDDEEDPKEDPADYPANRRDDDDDDDEDEDEEEEEHLAPANPTAIAFPVDQDPSDEETEPLDTDESAATPPSPPQPTYCVMARMSIRPQAPAPFLSEKDAKRLLALPTPPLSPLSPYSSPLPQIPSLPLPIPSPPPNSPMYSERPCRTAPTPGYEVGESSAAGAARHDGPAVARTDLYGFVDMVDAAPGRLMSSELGYGVTDTWDDLVRAIEEIVPTTLEGVNQRVTNLSTTVEQETTIMDRPVHRRLAVMIEREARMAREAWGLSIDASDYACSDVMSLRTTIVGQRALISELQSADHRRQGVIKELFAADHQRQVQLTKALKLLKGLQTHMAKF